MGICLVGNVFAYASDGKNKNDDPDMTGNVTQTVNGKPLKDVYITAYIASRKEKVTISDANGNFNMINLRPGVYKFVFQKDGFKRVVREKIVLKTKEDYQLNIEMAEEEAIFDLVPSPLRFAET